MLSCKISGTR